MATSEQKRQKKLQKKKQKQKLVKKLSNLLVNKNPVTLFSKYPIHECLVPNDLFDTGIGQITISRRSPSGDIGLSAFIVDVYCLGIKNALFTIADEHKYNTMINPRIMSSAETDFTNVHPSCARKIIEGSVQYARQFDFSPHPEYKKYSAIFGGIDKSVCPEKYTFGKDGKPFYINGPNETSAQSQQIINQLSKKCGEGNFDYMMDVGDILE